MTRDEWLALDQRWSAKVRIAEKPGPRRKLAILLAHSGDSWFWLLGLALVWWRGTPQAKLWSLEASGTILVLAVLVLTIKLVIRRERPEGEWGAIYRKSDPHSFPSGHAARAVMLAVLAIGEGPPWLGAALSLWAPLVSLARVSMGVHFLSDVLAGAALGLLAGVTAVLLLP